jgi:hypothetical protein
MFIPRLRPPPRGGGAKQIKFILSAGRIEELFACVNESLGMVQKMIISKEVTATAEATECQLKGKAQYS